MNDNLADFILTSSELDGAGIYCKRAGCVWGRDGLDGSDLPYLIALVTEHAKAHR